MWLGKEINKWIAVVIVCASIPENQNQMQNITVWMMKRVRCRVDSSLWTKGWLQWCRKDKFL